MRGLRTKPASDDELDVYAIKLLRTLPEPGLCHSYRELRTGGQSPIEAFRGTLIDAGLVSRAEALEAAHSAADWESERT